jgi:hypothetical protein
VEDFLVMPWEVRERRVVGDKEPGIGVNLGMRFYSRD